MEVIGNYNIYTKIMDEFLFNYRLQYDLRFWQHVHCVRDQSTEDKQTIKGIMYGIWNTIHIMQIEIEFSHGHYISMMSKKAVRQSFYDNLFEVLVANRFIM